MTIGTLTNEELLRKATFSTSDLGGAGESPLTIEQVMQFIRLAITPQVMLPDVRTVTSNSNKWQESKIDFADRILKPGTEGQRLVDADRTKATTGVVEISTVLVRGEVPITDEVLEDNVERSGFSDTVVSLIAEAAGRDLEELAINGDTAVAGSDPFLGLQDGWIKLAKGTGTNTYDAVGDGQDYQTVFRQMITKLPDKYKRDITNMRFYAPLRLVEKYRDILASRGTPLGDMMLTSGGDLTYTGYKIVGVPLMAITAGSPDTSHILFTNSKNLYMGWRRQIKLETWRDPREGATSFIVSARVNTQIGHVPATVIATNVNVEP